MNSDFNHPDSCRRKRAEETKEEENRLTVEVTMEVAAKSGPSHNGWIPEAVGNACRWNSAQRVDTE